MHRQVQGDTSLDRGDHSLTVIRLLNCLARWTGGDAGGITRYDVVVSACQCKVAEQKR